MDFDIYIWRKIRSTILAKLDQKKFQTFDIGGAFVLSGILGNNISGHLTDFLYTVLVEKANE